MMLGGRGIVRSGGKLEYLNQYHPGDKEQSSQKRKQVLERGNARNRTFLFPERRHSL